MTRYLVFIFATLFAIEMASFGATTTQQASSAEVNSHRPKMVWAHQVGWGFHFQKLFDRPDNALARLYDRTLLGEWVNTDQGITTTTRLQILSAKQYGIDGFMVDIVAPSNYNGGMGRFYDAAEGLDFRIALCVDGWNSALSVDQIVGYMDDFLKKWGHHPNNCFINGRPVVFIYNATRSPQECAAIVAGLRAKGHNPYWLIQPQREMTLWDNQQLIDDYLKCFDGLYDFGTNGFTLQDMKTKLRNGRRALDKKGGGILVGGITHGYMSGLNGFYRPTFNTRTLRDNWNAAMTEGADWVGVTTWNDYIETTQFEPSVWGRDSLARINREYIRQWRGEPVPARPPEVLVSYRQEVRLGDDWTVELLSFPYTTEPVIGHIKILDLNGKLIKEYITPALPRSEIKVETFRFQQPGMDSPRQLQVWAGVQKASESAQAVEWKHLYPIVIRPGTAREVRTLRFPLSDVLSSVPGLTVTPKEGRLHVETRMIAWMWAGTVELLRNGRVIARENIAKNGPMETIVSFTVDAEQGNQQLYITRFSQPDGKFIFSVPVLQSSSEGQLPVTMPVFTRNEDFDEGWMSSFRQRSVRHTSVLNANATLNEIPGFCYRMNDRKWPLSDTGGWNIFATSGVLYDGGRNDLMIPQWAEGAGPDGSQRPYLQFDGKASAVAIETRALPTDGWTLETWVRPRRVGNGSCLFSDENGSLDLGISADGKAFVQRGDIRALAATALPPGQWVHLAATYDGSNLILYVNQAETARQKLPPRVYAFNSLASIGCAVREYATYSQYFEGDIAGVAVTGRPLNPQKFSLINK